MLLRLGLGLFALLSLAVALGLKVRPDLLNVAYVVSYLLILIWAIVQ